MSLLRTTHCRRCTGLESVIVASTYLELHEQAYEVLGGAMMKLIEPFLLDNKITLWLSLC